MAFGLKVSEEGRNLLKKSIDPTFAFKVDKTDKTKILFNTKVELEEAKDYIAKYRNCIPLLSK